MREQPDLEAIAARRLAAHQMVNDLCRGRREWIMSIPAQPDYDPDLVIDNSLRDIPPLLEWYRRANQVAEAADRYLNGYDSADAARLVAALSEWKGEQDGPNAGRG